MATLFDSASLALIPSGVKDGKLYSIKPTDGSGDLSFSRSNDTATRVNSSGLIEKVRTNVTLYSEDYTNAYWTKSDVTLTANSIANPVDGATTAETITPTTDNTSHYLRSTPIAMSASTEVSQSIYAKANGYNYVMLEGYDGSNNPKIMFNISDGSFSTISSSGSPVGSVEALANGWYRLKMTWQTQAGSPNVYQYYLAFDNASANSFSGNGTSGVYLFGAQLEYGVTTDYIATTSAAVSVGPVANLPRLDYLNSSCPRLLLEGQRQNGFQFSEQADNAYWTKTNCTISANNAVSPDGYTNADKIVENTATGLHGVQSDNFTSSAGVVSVFVKAAGRTFFNISEANGAGGFYNLTTGAATGSFATASMQDYGNGWWRCVLQYTFPSAFATNFRFYAATSMSVNSYAGDGSSGVLIYGAQFENGAAYATSYIPTLSAASTRGADAASKTGISSLIGQTEGTIFWEFQVDTPSAVGHEQIFNIDGGSYGNTFYIFKTSGALIISQMVVGGVLQASYTSSTIGAGTYKCALAYANNNTAFFINGVQVGTTDTSCSVPATSRIQFGNGVFGPSTDLTKQALVFKTRLTNAELAALTTI